MAVLLFSLATACSSATGSSAADSGNSADAANGPDASNANDIGKTTPPTVLSSSPSKNATGVPLNASPSVTFSEAMDASTLGVGSFTVTSGAAALAIPGKVTYSNTTAVFWPTAHFAPSTAYTATLTTAAKSAVGVALGAKYAWSFTTGDSLAALLPVNLGTAGNFAILAKTGISTVPTSSVTGNIAVSPAAATYITGFSLTADATNVFATSPQVTGKVFAANYAPPSPPNLTTAVGDMGIAFTDAAARAPDVTELGAGNIGGKTVAPGVYKWATGLLIPTSVTLTGGATDVWIFQIAQNLTVSSAAKILLAGGALPKNVFWQVAGQVDLGTTAHLEGVILCKSAITLHTGASINGRLLAQTAVKIDGSAVVAPAP